MKEIFVNGVEFRYRTERDLGLILRHAREPARLRFLSQLCRDVARRKIIINKIMDRADRPETINGPLLLVIAPRQ